MLTPCCSQARTVCIGIAAPREKESEREKEGEILIIRHSFFLRRGGASGVSSSVSRVRALVTPVLGIAIAVRATRGMSRKLALDSFKRSQHVCINYRVVN